LSGLLISLPVFAESFGEQQAELSKLQRYVSEVSTRMEQLQKLLKVSEQRNKLQSELIKKLETRLSAQSAHDPSRIQQQREAFFSELAKRLSLSPVYRVDADRLVVYVDPVYIFRTAEIGAEGEARLADLAVALEQAVQTLPPGLKWRLHVQGHSDIRAPSSGALYSNNWDLSSARAVSFLRLLLRGGLDEQQVYASGLAATRLVAKGDNKADHRENRRIEVHLDLHELP